MMKHALLSLAALLLATPGFAQSADPVFGNWSWTPETLAAEATGLGGAHATTVRGTDALYWSPAALTYDGGLDVRINVGARPGIGVVRHGEKLHVGFGVRRTFSRTIHGGGFDAASGVFEVGQLAMMVDQATLGAGWRAGRLRLGVAVAAGPFTATGAWSRARPSPETPGGVVETRYDYTGASEWQFGASSSAIVELLDTHPMARRHGRLGVAVRWPTLLRTPRYRRSELELQLAAPPTSGMSPLTPFRGEGPDLQRFRQPMTISLGAEARLGLFSMLRSIRLVAGADWADYDGVLETARSNQPDGARLAMDDNRPWTFGGGIEAVHPLLRMRIGMRERAGHHLVLDTPRTVRRARARTTFGVSRDALLAGKRVQVDVDSTSAFDDLVVALRLLW